MKLLQILPLVVMVVVLLLIIHFYKSSSEKVSKNDEGIDKHLDYFKSLRRTAVALSKSEFDGFGQIGGLPQLSDDIKWPEWKGSPLSFLCQLDLSQLPEDCERNGLPAKGFLYFFYDQQQKTWGFDPKDKGSWQVIYSYKSRDDLSERQAPKGLVKSSVYKMKQVNFKPVETYPDWQDDRIYSLDFTDAQDDEYAELCSGVFQGEPEHHLFGYPAPVQGDEMDLECQLVSNGLYCGDPSGYEDPKAKELEFGRGDWILLLQLDTDDDTNMMWGDCGRLYFWIKKDDLRELRFENCWMILQCG